MVQVSPDAPSVRTLPEGQRLGDVDRAFRDDKTACFGIERVRLMTPHRLDRLLLGVAIAQVLLVSLATRLLMEGGEASVDAHGSGGLSLLQLGARYLRSEAWQGRTPRMQIGDPPLIHGPQGGEEVGDVSTCGHPAEAVMTHELGHTIGMQENPLPPIPTPLPANLGYPMTTCYGRLKGTCISGSPFDPRWAEYFKCFYSQWER